MKSHGQWKITLKYCKQEFLATLAWFTMGYSCLTLAMTSNLVLAFNEYQLPLNMYISSFSWSLNYFLQVLATVSVSIYVFNQFSITLILINHTCYKADTVLLLIAEMNETLRGPIERAVGITKKLNAIVTESHEMQVWQAKVQNLFGIIFLTEFTILSIMFALVMHTIQANFRGCLFVVMMTSAILAQLFVYCWMGSRYKSRIDELTAAIYSLDWYVLTADQRMSLVMIMRMTQNMKEFNGIFSTVSLRTFQSVRDFGMIRNYKIILIKIFCRFCNFPTHCLPLCLKPYKYHKYYYNDSYLMKLTKSQIHYTPRNKFILGNVQTLRY